MRGGVAPPITEIYFVSSKQYLRTNSLRVPKSHFWLSALDLPHPCGFCGRSEFAAFIKSVPLKMPQKGETGRRAKRTAGFPSDHEKMRRQLGAFFVNPISKISRKIQNHTFGFFPPICRKACGKKVKPRDLSKVCPSLSRGEGETAAAQNARRCLLQNHGKKFYRLKTFFVNH